MRVFPMTTAIVIVLAQPTWAQEEAGEPAVPPIDAPIPMPGDDAPIPMPGDDTPDDHGDSALAPVGIAGLVPISWDLRGYVEDTLNLEYREAKDRLFALNSARVRVNLEGKPNTHFDFGVGMVGTLNSGHTRIGLAQYLPEAEQAQLFVGGPAPGVPGARDLLVYELENRLYLQEAFATLYLPHLRIRAGRHKFYSGTGFAYNPIDLFNRKDPLDPTYEIDGIDALLVAIELPGQTEIQGLMGLGNRLDRTDYLARLETYLSGWDIALQYTHHIRRRTDWRALVSPAGAGAVSVGAPLDTFERTFRWQLIAAELSGEILGLGVHAEGGWTFADALDNAGTLTRAAEDHERLLVGFDYTFDFQLYVLVEYMRLGQGRAQTADIDLNDRMALFAGEILAIDRDILFAGVSFPLTDLTELAVYSIIGLNDPSAVVNPWLVVDVYPGVKLWITGVVPFGNEQGQNGKSGAGGFARLRFSF
ncbi:hypothetical protein ACFL6C_08545 [Myxococcota bacterium]